MFQTKNLAFKNILYYGDLHIIASNVNFITGKSGCGKSTLLKLLNKTESFSAGEILYKEKPLAEFDSIQLRKQVNLISQTPFLFQGTIRENFDLYYEYCEEKPLSEEKMTYFLRLTEGDFPHDSPCETLSGGERQRVYLAICLSFDAETIMLDEPSSALDEALSYRVLKNILHFAKSKGKTVIVISHNQDLIKRFAEHIIDLDRMMSTPSKRC